MITTKTKEVFSLSDENKKTIKENAQKIKSHLIACGYDSCQDFIDCNDYDYWTFALETLKDFLPFVKEEIDYLYEKDAEKLSGKVIRLASREDVDIPVEEHLIVELYSK